VYAYETAFGGAEPCERQAVEQLVELRNEAAALARRDGRVAADRQFYTEQNARLAANAERYYRAVFFGGAQSWNLRDRHMVETLSELVAHLDRTQGSTKLAVWAHNSHLGDARATDMGRRGQLNVGQLLREQHATGTLLVGFTTFDGTVTAASDWPPSASASDAPCLEAGSASSTRPARRGSCSTRGSSEANGSSARSASSTARRRSACRTTSTPGWTSSSTP
jgi:erythromycin esterase-like protein